MGNISDYNSKTSFDSDPFLLVNSDYWRHGHTAFTDPVFPLEEMIYMKYVHGNLIKYQQPKMDTNTPVRVDKTWKHWKNASGTFHDLRNI